MHRHPRCQPGCASPAAAGPARPDADLTAFSLEQRLDLQGVGASRYEQKQNEVAAAVSVITRKEIRAFGRRRLAARAAGLTLSSKLLRLATEVLQ